MYTLTHNLTPPPTNLHTRTHTHMLAHSLAQAAQLARAGDAVEVALTGLDVAGLPCGAVLCHPDFPVPLVTKVWGPLPSLGGAPADLRELQQGAASHPQLIIPGLMATRSSSMSLHLGFAWSAHQHTTAPGGCAPWGTHAAPPHRPPCARSRCPCPPPQFEMRIVVLEVAVPLLRGQSATIHAHVAREVGHVSSLLALLNTRSGEVVKARPRCVHLHFHS